MGRSSSLARFQSCQRAAPHGGGLEGPLCGGPEYERLGVASRGELVGGQLGGERADDRDGAVGGGGRQVVSGTGASGQGFHQGVAVTAAEGDEEVVSGLDGRRVLPNPLPP